MKIKKEINKLVKKYKSVFAQEDKYKFALMLHLGPATKPFEIGSKYKLLTPSQFIDTSVAFIKNKKYKLYGILLKPKKLECFIFYRNGNTELSIKSIWRQNSCCRRSIVEQGRKTREILKIC